MPELPRQRRTIPAAPVVVLAAVVGYQLGRSDGLVLGRAQGAASVLRHLLGVRS